MSSENKPVAWVPVHPNLGPLWAMTTSDPHPERLPGYPLRELYVRAAPAEPSDFNSATLRMLEARAHEWVKDYEFDSGEGMYRPKEHERMLLLDCILGLIAEVESDAPFDHPAPAEPSEWTDARLRGIASDYFDDPQHWPAAMQCMRHLLMEQSKYPPRQQGETK